MPAHITCSEIKNVLQAMSMLFLAGPIPTRNQKTTEIAPEIKKPRKSLLDHLEVMNLSDSASTSAATARQGIVKAKKVILAIIKACR